jgi:hypothetical protein
MKLTVELPSAVHRDLLAYAEVLAHETGQGVVEPTKLIAPMLARFMATDRAFTKIRRATQAPSKRIALSRQLQEICECRFALSDLQCAESRSGSTQFRRGDAELRRDRGTPERLVGINGPEDWVISSTPVILSLIS